MAERTPGASMDRVTELLREVAIAPTVERARERSEELVRALVAFYGEGLERVLEIVDEAAGERAEPIFAALCGDAFVASLLELHGLHPLSIEERIEAALDAIRPYLASHEGNVELVRVEDGVAYVRLAGSCDGCQSSAATLKHAVETAIFERVGEIAEVRAEGVEVTRADEHSLRLHSDWVALESLSALATSGLAHVLCSDTAVLLVRRENSVFAYRDRCPSCTRALDDASLEWPFVRCAACAERFDVVHAGRVVDNPKRSAEPFPLVRDGERVRIAIPLGV